MPDYTANIAQPSASQLGGAQPLPWIRFPFFPTAPWLSTNPNVSYPLRYFAAKFSSTDSDYSVGSEINRPIQFDIPARVVAINGSAFLTATPSSGTVTELNMNLLYRFRIENSAGDKLHTTSMLAANVLGTAKQPGELGAHGYNVAQGSSLQVYVTPLVAGLTIDITFHCMQMLAPTNVSMG